METAEKTNDKIVCFRPRKEKLNEIKKKNKIKETT